MTKKKETYPNPLNFFVSGLSLATGIWAIILGNPICGIINIFLSVLNLIVAFSNSSQIKEIYD